MGLLNILATVVFKRCDRKLHLYLTRNVSSISGPSASGLTWVGLFLKQVDISQIRSMFLDWNFFFKEVFHFTWQNNCYQHIRYTSYMGVFSISTWARAPFEVLDHWRMAKLLRYLTAISDYLDARATTFQIHKNIISVGISIFKGYITPWNC